MCGRQIVRIAYYIVFLIPTWSLVTYRMSFFELQIKLGQLLVMSFDKYVPRDEAAINTYLIWYSSESERTIRRKLSYFRKYK